MNAIEQLRLIWGTEGQFPASWTRYLALDPGTSNCAVLFGVCPPAEKFGPRLIIEDEILVHRVTPTMLAPIVADKVAGRVYEWFVIDYRAGRQTTMGSEQTVEQQYANAFAKCGVTSIQTGSSFLPGSDDVQARAMEVREWLRPGQEGGPRCLFVLEKTIETQREFKLYKKRVVNRKDVREEPVDKDNHLMNDLEYMISRNPKYVFRPGAVDDHASPAWHQYQQHLKRMKKDAGKYVNLGPVTTPA